MVKATCNQVSGLRNNRLHLAISFIAFVHRSNGFTNNLNVYLYSKQPRL